ncbi:DNA polymerase IV [Labrys wisconsinensis]|uniref:DNA polymerase IV n=1 Tax=Labrys wisconsinensis TaxID=425677 RepID=A0ABU0J352_9HYPH|nr:DNA polymerase IV [Labrys wisconsinensis]MDQ0468687.1 DNA polymerase-4 [Labrys wisconsinensis]
MAAICRDCLTGVDEGERCPACRSPRIVRHAELDGLSIAHVDCDAFYAAVEKRDDPSLLDRPVIVGGRRRGVVSTACYIARTYGVRSAMPMFKALAACPDAVVIKPNMEKYVQVGRQVRAMMLAMTPLVEPLSIDEAFLDLTGTERLHGGSPARTLLRFARQVEQEIGITVSIGLSGNKFLAKLASDLEKPRGFTVLSPAEAKAFLAPRPVSFIWGIGKAGAERYERDGLRTIADLQRAGERELVRRYGAEGLRLAQLALGIDRRKVDPDGDRKSVSAETTFDHDLAAAADLMPVLWRLSERVSGRLKAAGLAGSTVTLKLKSADFRLRTRARTLHEPTRLAARIFAAGRDLLRKETDGTRYRLIGIGVSELTDIADGDLGDLADSQVRRQLATEEAIDALRARFGKDAVQKGIVFRTDED